MLPAPASPRRRALGPRIARWLRRPLARPAWARAAWEPAVAVRVQGRTATRTRTPRPPPPPTPPPARRRPVPPAARPTALPAAPPAAVAARPWERRLHPPRVAVS